MPGATSRLCCTDLDGDAWGALNTNVIVFHWAQSAELIYEDGDGGRVLNLVCFLFGKKHDTKKKTHREKELFKHILK